VSEAEQGEGAAPRSASRWRRRLKLAAAAGAVLVVVLRVALPYALEAAVPVGAERFGLDATLENVDFALLRGHVTLEGLRVAPLAATTSGDEAPDLLRLGRLFVDLEWLGLFGGTIEVADLELEKPELALVRAEDGYLELPALPPSTERKAEEEETPPEEAGDPMPVVLHSLTLRETSFRLVDASGGGDLLDFDLKELGLAELELAGAQVGLGGIRISEPRISVRRELQETELGARGSSTAAAEPSPEEESAPPELRIDDLAIEEAGFQVVTDGEPVAMALRLKLNDLSFAPDSPFPVDLGIEVGEGSLALLGQLGLNPLVWDGKVSWESLSVPLLVRAAAPELIPWIRSCAASGELDVQFTSDGVRVTGQGGIADFAFEDPEQELALGWNKLQIEVEELAIPLGAQAEPMQLSLGTISLEAPSARYVLPNTAVDRLVASAGGGGAASEESPQELEPADPTAPEPRIRIEAIQVRGGEAEFVDRSGDEPYQGKVRNLSVDVEDVSFPERTVGQVRVRGLAPKRAPFDLKAALPGASGNASFKLESLPLSQFSPYAASAADLRIPTGALSLDTNAKLARSGAAGTVKTEVRVHELTLDGAVDAITVAGMPLNLVLALLRDAKGDIVLPIPLQYGEAGASTEITTVLVGALTAAVKGAATSPLKAAGALLPDGGDDAVSFDPIAFAPGGVDVPSSANARVASTARLLGERPTLGLTLRGSAGPEDRDVLAERILIERVVAGNGMPDLSDAPFFARRRVKGVFEARGRGEEGEELSAEDAALLQRYIAATEVSNERFLALAQGRADAVRARFEEEHEIDPVRLTAEAAAAPGAAQVELELGLAVEGEPVDDGTGEGASGELP
jgi:hypothetical protein